MESTSIYTTFYLLLSRSHTDQHSKEAMFHPQILNDNIIDIFLWAITVFLPFLQFLLLSV